MRRWLAIGALAFAACRTEIKPLVKAEPVKKARAADGECAVRDFPGATDVPSGSAHLGWVKVPRQETDEASFEALRKEVCARGGDAMSQMRWVRASGASVADPPIELEANAWLTP